MQEVKKEGLVGNGLLPPPALSSHEGKQLQVWVVGVGAKCRAIDTEMAYQVVEITKTDVVVACEKEHWALDLTTLVYLI